MPPDEEILDKLTVGSVISSGWVKRLDRPLKRRLDRRLLRNQWRLEPAKMPGHWVIVYGKPANAVIELELNDGQNRTDVVYD